MSLKNSAFIDWGILNTAIKGGKSCQEPLSLYMGERCWWVYPASRYLIDYMESREGFWLAWALVIQAYQDTEADCGCKMCSQASPPLWLWLPQLSQKPQNHVAAYGVGRYLTLPSAQWGCFEPNFVFEAGWGSFQRPCISWESKIQRAFARWEKDHCVSFGI